MTGLVLLCLTVFVVATSESSQDSHTVEDLLLKEKERSGSATTKVKTFVERASASLEQEATNVVYNLAIPELPEFRWRNTRKWNLPLNNPAVTNANDAFFLDPEDVVCGVLVGKEARAYPWFVFANYHAINDQLGGLPIIVNLCEACNGGAAFEAKVKNDLILDFRPMGVKNGTWYAVDFQTGSRWYPFSGEAFDGPLKGTKLNRVRFYFSTWRNWVKDHPETTVVLSNDEVRERPHGKLSHMANDLTFNPKLLRRIQDPIPNPRRTLLRDFDLVFGLIPEEGGTPTAYEFEDLKESDEPISLEFNDEPLILLHQRKFQIGAYVRMLDGTELTLESQSTDPLILEDQLGNRWNAFGRTLSGPNHPAELRLANGYITKWYEWIENYPTSDLVGVAHAP